MSVAAVRRTVHDALSMLATTRSDADIISFPIEYTGTSSPYVAGGP